MAALRSPSHCHDDVMIYRKHFIFIFILSLTWGHGDMGTWNIESRIGRGIERNEEEK